MTKQKEDTATKRRTQVNDLPREEKELTKGEQRKVKGGDWLMTPAGNAKPSK